MVHINYIKAIFTPLILLFLLVTGCSNEQSLNFKMSSEEALKSITASEYLISTEEFKTLTQQGKDNLLVVDLRSPADYTKGHLSDAINIPIADLLDDEPLSSLSNSNSIVLYSRNAFEASGPAMLLIQLGVENVKVLNTGYEGYADTLIAPVSELPRYDYALVFQKAVEQHEKEIKAGTRPVIVPVAPAQKRIIPKPKPKVEEEEEEGC